MTPEREALAARIELAIREVLGDCIRPAPERDALTDGALTVLCMSLAQIAQTAAPPAPTFRHIGRRRAEQELRRMARLARARVVLPLLHGTSIDALAAVGWTRDRLTRRPDEAKPAAVAAIAWLNEPGRQLAPPDMKPADHQAWAFVLVVAGIYERLTGRRPARGGLFQFLLERLSDDFPGLGLRPEWHARNAERLRRASKSQG